MQFVPRFDLDDVATPAGLADRGTIVGCDPALWDDDRILDAALAAHEAPGALRGRRHGSDADLIGRRDPERSRAMRA